MHHRRVATTVAALSLMAGMAATTAAEAKTVRVSELKLSSAKMAKLRTSWVDQIYAHHSLGTWAPMRFDLTDADLRTMGLPSKKVLLRHRYRRPTAFYPGGRMVRLSSRAGARGKPKPGGGGSGGTGTTAAGPGVVSFAGTGFFGIRPGAWLLFIDTNAGSVG